MSGTATTLNPGFDIYATYLHVLEDRQVGQGVSKLRDMLLKMILLPQISPPLGAIMALTELMANSRGEFSYSPCMLTKS